MTFLVDSGKPHAHSSLGFPNPRKKETITMQCIVELSCTFFAFFRHLNNACYHVFLIPWPPCRFRSKLLSYEWFSAAMAYALRSLDLMSMPANWGKRAIPLLEAKRMEVIAMKCPGLVPLTTMKASDVWNRSRSLALDYLFWKVHSTKLIRKKLAPEPEAPATGTSFLGCFRLCQLLARSP